MSVLSSHANANANPMMQCIHHLGPALAVPWIKHLTETDLTFKHKLTGELHQLGVHRSVHDLKTGIYGQPE